MAGEGGARPGTFWTKGDDTFHTEENHPKASEMREAHAVPIVSLDASVLPALPHTGPSPRCPR